MELGQIEAHVERALFYARAESPEKDFMVRQTSLASIVVQAIENHRSLLHYQFHIRQRVAVPREKIFMQVMEENNAHVKNK